MTAITNASLEYEAAQSARAWEELTSTDNTVFTGSYTSWSKVAGKEAVVYRYGILTGCLGVPAILSSQTDVTVARPTVSDYLITSITVNAAGAIANVQGTEGSSFSETRAAAGGPPLIPVDSVELFQVKYDSQTAGPVLVTEIFQVDGDSSEVANFPVQAVNTIMGTVTFNQALPAIHTGAVAAKVFAKVFTPSYAEVPHVSDYVPATTTHTLASIDRYDGPQGSASSSIQQASFNAGLGDGTTDSILDQVNKNILIRFKHDRDSSSYQLTQGILGYTATFAPGAHPEGSFTLTPELSTSRYAS
jgi:hypothetical protein